MTQAEQIYNKHECARYDKSTGEFRPNYEAILAAIQEALDSKEKELQELREAHKRNVIDAYNDGAARNNPFYINSDNEGDDYYNEHYTKTFTNEK